MATNALSIIDTIATLVEAMAVAVTLIYVIRQTNATYKSVLEVQKEIKLTALSVEKSTVKDINFLLVQNEELSNLLGYSRSDMLAFILLHDCEQRYDHWRNGFINDSNWLSERRLISKVMNYPFVKNAWPKIKEEYHTGFVDFADDLVIPCQSNSTNETIQPA
jgi:hypothetical protein